MNNKYYNIYIQYNHSFNLITGLFIKFREKKFWIAWIANIAVSIAYFPAMLLTLILMV